MASDQWAELMQNRDLHQVGRRSGYVVAKPGSPERLLGFMLGGLV